MSRVHVQVREKKAVQTIPVQGKEPFKKQELLTFSKEGNTPLKFEFSGNSIKLLENVLIGQELIVEYNTRGNFYQQKDKKGNIIGNDIINSFSAYKITIL